jgi:hypothetical protein
MPVEQFDTSFGSLSHSEFIVTVGNFADHLLAHPFFKENWPSFLTHPLQLKEQLNAYNESVEAADLDGGRKNMKAREDRRNAAHASTILMGQYVVMRSVSENDKTLLETVGLKLKNRPKSSVKPAASSPMPPTVTAKHGKASRRVVLSYSKVAGGGSYEIQICRGDPNVESSWSVVGQYKQCRVEIEGLEPAQTVYFRVRCHGAGEPGPFSNIVSIIVL